MNEEEIRRLARLAAIDIRDDEIEHARKAINSIMTLIDQMKDVPTEAVAPLTHPANITTTLRDDEARERDAREAMQSIAPAVAKGLYKVPPVID